MQLIARFQKLSAWWDSLPDELSLRSIPLRKRPSAIWPLGVLPAFAHALFISPVAFRLIFWFVFVGATLLGWFTIPILLTAVYLFFFSALKEERHGL